MDKNEMESGRSRWSYWAWLIVLVAGLGFGAWLGIFNYQESMENGQADVAVGNGFSSFVFIAVVAGLVSLVLWFRRYKPLPSLAFIVILILGIFFSLFGFAESIGGFTSKPIDYSLAFGGLMEFGVFGLPFLVIAWLLWTRPKIAGLLLMLLGVGMGVWMFLDWNIEIRPGDASEIIMPSLLTVLPILLGAFTFSRAMISGKKKTMENSHA